VSLVSEKSDILRYKNLYFRYLRHKFICKLAKQGLNTLKLNETATILPLVDNALEELL
jgi:hypothetical protein